MICVSNIGGMDIDRDWLFQLANAKRKQSRTPNNGYMANLIR